LIRNQRSGTFLESKLSETDRCGG